ncbi:class I SAM-dependent methyltransferase [bacterium (Candidatus Blackallbacteria) CG17_big_fil_post_rev_8_21_14_2_50_48_46]|uniref:Class I SAM-dependent methyltransferase n=1 Tax=bacterium (Candidatus Blackallbacteria) CG17_big_fil_post_rev_8_21_14_2_50_48_46 TaxID=2014261 RepID=A0A2M7G928_9BACT|nr:MAG: methyltransferase [bacterium (Candidatus Blackallbacteria) CG18_big_fil_WC_8_21_14_2_50_49_26]PIW18610.1 MAG: class I SAM-dependent methyltransferase [bacterium (Candidatus Blackallbacteria) CG17_big_fil_post_rev_8_21_14_2_50_48_46]PIW46404.1 MAG: class I SAM-dependent methyltransferase [bacterium (Candidatus Blackallbacteria) CG13_big_fil_rev_8_21_14_2_50_49_14]
MLSGVPATSLWALRAKAEENQKDKALLQDALAAEWYPKIAWLFDEALEAQYSQILQKAIVLRTLILDRLVKTHFQKHKNPGLLELGCGFSTRFARISPSQGNWYDLDLPEIIELRASLGFPSQANHWHIVASAFENDWFDYLQNQNPQELLIIAEGLLMYFPLERVKTLIFSLKQKFPGAYFAFDVIGSMHLKSAQNAAEQTESPIYWGTASISQFCKEMELEIAGDLSLGTHLSLIPRLHSSLSPLTRSLLRWKWLSDKMGGSVLTKL